MIVADFRYHVRVEACQNMKMPEIARGRIKTVSRLPGLPGTLLLACILLTPTVRADEAPPVDANSMHPLMTSKYWAKAGGFFAARDLSVSATGSIGPAPSPTPTEVDFESETGLDD